MRKIIFLILGLGLLLPCCKIQKNKTANDTPKEEATEPKSKPSPLPPHTKTPIGGSESFIKGKLLDVHREPVPFVAVLLTSATGERFGAYSDVDGNYELKAIPKGEYSLRISAVGFTEMHFGPLKLDEGLLINFELIEVKEIEIIVLKPIIYLYPDTAMDVHVALDYAGKLIHTYPRYPVGGWQVAAHPDGILYDDKQRAYYALYWEGSQAFASVPENGKVVASEETIPFLERSLSQLGLTDREANEFILYWLPQLEKNPYNLIHFATEDYAKEVPLHIDPQPNVVIRLMMTAVALQHPIDYPLQVLPSLSKERNGFCVVEWGGQWLHYSQLALPHP